MTNGTLLVGFGIEKPGDRSVLISNAERLKVGDSNVYYAFIGRDSPTIEESMQKMADDGVDNVVVIPFLMAAGEKSKVYIPRRLGIEGEVGTYNIEDSKIMTVRYTNVIGESPMIVDIIDSKIKEMGAIDSGTAIMVVTYGSQMIHSASMAQYNAEKLIEKGYKNVLTAFVDYNEPTIEDCANFLMSRGLDKIIIVPLFISEDPTFNERVCNAFSICGGEKDATVVMCNREADINIMEPIGSDPRMTDVLKSMIRKALEH